MMERILNNKNVLQFRVTIERQRSDRAIRLALIQAPDKGESMLSFYQVLALPRRIRNRQNNLSLNHHRSTRRPGMARNSMSTLVALVFALVCVFGNARR